MFAGKRTVPAPHGQLEAIYRPSSESAERVALVLHPHPLYGGTMHNPVVFHCARSLHEAGYETLRFNFRGVGESTGEFDHGRGEVDDARAALDFLLEHQPAARDVVVAGFSFGAGVALRFGCEDVRVNRLVAIGTPALMVDPAALSSCAKPKLFLHGDRDDVAPLAALRPLLETRAAQPWDLRVVAGADHFFPVGFEEMRATIRSFVAG